MSDIGIFSTADLMVLALVACAPGFVIGAAAALWFSRRHGWRQRLVNAALSGLAGFALAFAGWWVYLTVIK